MRQIHDHRITDEQYEQFALGIESVVYIRCMKHRGVPAYNRNENPGECAACIVEVIEAGLNNLLLDLYPLTIANAPMTATEQRLFADDVAGHIGKLRAALAAVETTNEPA